MPPETAPSGEPGPVTVTAAVLVKINYPHDRALECDYHEWVDAREPLKIDRLGRPNPRMMFSNASLWVCNNPDCPAQAFVSDAAIQALIEAEEDPLDQILSHR